MQEQLEILRAYAVWLQQNAWTAYVAVFEENVLFLVLTAVVFVLLVAAAVISVRSRSMHVYNGIGAIVVGSFFGLTGFGALPQTATQIVLPLLSVHGGACYLIAYAIVAARHRATQKKRREEEKRRALQFTLPDRDNAFVRNRLQTVLNASLQEERSADKGEKPSVENFSHAQKLLEKLKGEKLSLGDKLQTEDMQKLLEGYMQKESWTSEDVRVVNEAFNALLKLSAKYAL